MDEKERKWGNALIDIRIFLSEELVLKMNERTTKFNTERKYKSGNYRNDKEGTYERY